MCFMVFYGFKDFHFFFHQLFQAKCTVVKLHLINRDTKRLSVMPWINNLLYFNMKHPFVNFHWSSIFFKVLFKEVKSATRDIRCYWLKANC